MKTLDRRSLMAAIALAGAGGVSTLALAKSKAPAGRKLAGKPEIGLVKITATRHGKRIAIEVLDDGAGLDLARIEERARALGWLAPGEEATQATLESFVLRAGAEPSNRPVTALLAGAAGLEPATCGFGDRRSTN